MKILSKNLNKGILKVLVDNPDDLWYLNEIIEEDDKCRAKTIRKIKIGDENNPKIVKKPALLTISVEKTEFHESTGNLRVSGKIIDGPDDMPRGNYHSFTLEPGKDITIIKDYWPKHLLQKIDESQKVASQYLIVIFDREKAVFAELKKRNYKIISSINVEAQSKRIPEQRAENIYKEISKLISDYTKNKDYSGIIIGSANFWRDYIKKELPNELKKKVVYATVSSVDESAISELIKRPELKTLLEQERMVQELSLIDTIKEAISKDNACYGINDCKQKIAEGNIKLLIVSNNLIKKFRLESKDNKNKENNKNNFQELKNLMHTAENMQAELHIISADKAAKQLDSLSGIAGVCRW